MSLGDVTMKQLLIISIIMMFCSICGAVETGPQTFTMFVAKMKPCVILEEDEDTGEINITGFEIDLWKAIGMKLRAEGLIKDTKFVPVEWSQIEAGIKSGEASGACAGLSIRAERMGWASFSMPTMNSGLGIMILNEDGNIGIIQGSIIIIQAMQGPIMVFAAFIVFFSLILWISERDNDDTNDENGISDKFFPGIFEAMYFCIVTCSTVGYGDFAPKKWRTRACVVVLIVVGLGMFANFLSLLSVARIENTVGNINAPSDLKGKVVLTQKGTTSVNAVRKLGAKPSRVDDIDSACDGLLLGRADAVVFDYPVLLSYVKENPDKVKMVAGMFDEQYYAYMLKKDSPLEKGINLALQQLYEDGTYKTFYDKWF